MQLCSADAAMFKKKKLSSMKAWKNRSQKLLIIGPNFVFQYCQPAQNQPKSHVLFHNFDHNSIALYWRA